jgi:HSP20 family protein
MAFFFRLGFTSRFIKVICVQSCAAAESGTRLAFLWSQFAEPSIWGLALGGSAREQWFGSMRITESRGENAMTCTSQRNRLSQFVPARLADFDSFFGQVLGPEGLQAVTGWRAPASIWEANDQFHVELDVPGVALEDIELTVDKGTLKISVERKEPDRERKYWHNERSFGQVTRSLSLPESADSDAITADLNAGVLHVIVAKVPEAQPKRIDVKVG